ncbi:hypothetical protein GCM10023189_13420 [Nibrella saemangeumensis]|uniref:YD repeat-containing protein n=1 Tax=Nibrella saemangeumensis TaxID=1084526 RepID=A0ABP8MLM4_9BACT
MKTAFLLPIVLLLNLLFGCQGNEPKPANSELNPATPVTTSHQLTKVVYTEGYNEGVPRLSSTTTFTYNADGYLVKYIRQSTLFNEQNPTSQGATLSYTPDGLLARVDRFGGNPAYETYSYSNRKLFKVEFYERGSLIYRYDVTTNSQGQVTEMVGSRHWDDISLSAYHVRFSLDKTGTYMLADFISNGRVDYQIQLNNPDASIRNPYSNWKGVPFDITRHFLTYVEEPPVYGWRAYNKVITQIGEVFKGNYVGLRTLMESTTTVQVNAQGLPTERIVKEYTDTNQPFIRRSNYEYTPAQTRQ